jgi:hypothetical protein
MWEVSFVVISRYVPNHPKSRSVKLTSFIKEIKPTMIEPLRAKHTLKACELQDGDIITFQRSADKKDKNSVEKKSGVAEHRTSDEM